jgi:tetratricopeptide (TPR) repeat protein
MVDMMSDSIFLISVSFMPLWLSSMNDTLKEYSPVIDNMVGVAFPILKLTAFLVCFYLLIIILCWMVGFIYKGAIILPFDNATKDNKYDGKGISDLLIADMRRIHELQIETSCLGPGQERNYPFIVKYGMNQFHTSKFPSVSSGLMTESLFRNFANMGSIGSSGNMISVGHLFLILRRLCPFGHAGSVVTGSIQKYDKDFYLIAHLEQHDGAKAWRVSDTLENDTSIPNLVNELALRIYKDTSPQCNVRTCDGLRYYIDALDMYEHYNHHKKIECLDSCHEKCLQALYYEKGHRHLFHLCFQVGLDYLDLGLFEKSTKILSQAAIKKENIEISRICQPPRTFSKPVRFVAEVNADCERMIFHEYSAAWNMLGIAQENLALIGEAYQSYKKSNELDTQYWAPYYNLGRVCSKLEKENELIIAYYKKAIDIEPKMPMIHVSLAAVYKKSNMTDDYRSHCEIAKKYIDNEEVYNQACFEVVCVENYSKEKVISLLKAALLKNQVSPKWAMADPDLSPLAADKNFLETIEGLKTANNR